MGCPKKYRLTLVFLLIETTTVTRRADTASERRLKLLPRVSIAKNRKNVLHFFLFYKVIWQAPCDVIVVWCVYDACSSNEWMSYNSCDVIVLWCMNFWSELWCYWCIRPSWHRKAKGRLTRSLRGTDSKLLPSFLVSSTTERTLCGILSVRNRKCMYRFTLLIFYSVNLCLIYLFWQQVYLV